jgi:hypothetical protein
MPNRVRGPHRTPAEEETAMVVTALSIGNRSVVATMSLTDFLEGPVMSHLAALNNGCSPVDILRDYLPGDITEMDDDCFAQALEEACVQAASFVPAGADPVEFLELQQVRLCPADLVAARQRLLPNHGLRLVGMEPAPLVA